MSTEKLYKVQCGAFKEKSNADNLAKKIKASGFDPIIMQVNNLYKVQCGAFAQLDNANKRKSDLEKVGFNTIIVEEEKKSSSGTQKSYDINKQFSDETQKIIDAHKADFNCTNYKEKLKSYGGYNSYLNKLGGVFKKWNGKTADVKTVSELHEIAEYVFGLMSIFGFDYNNGKIYRRWTGGSPFYVNGKKGRSNWGRIDDLCSKSSKDKTTNCNYGMDSLLYKSGLYGKPGQPTNSCAFRSHIKHRKFKFFRNQNDLKIGDLVQFFGSEVKTDNCNDWKNWHHVAIVGDIVDGKIIMFDSGGRFITTGKYKHEFKVDKNNKPIGDYSSYKGWVAIRSITLKDE